MNETLDDVGHALAALGASMPYRSFTEPFLSLAIESESSEQAAASAEDCSPIASGSDVPDPVAGPSSSVSTDPVVIKAPSAAAFLRELTPIPTHVAGQSACRSSAPQDLPGEKQASVIASSSKHTPISEVFRVLHSRPMLSPIGFHQAGQLSTSATKGSANCLPTRSANQREARAHLESYPS